MDEDFICTANLEDDYDFLDPFERVEADAIRESFEGQDFETFNNKQENEI